MRSIIEKISMQLNEEKRNGNYLINQISEGKCQIFPPVLRGSQIHPKMADLVAMANFEVLIKFYKIQLNSDGARALAKALKSLNEKGIRNKKPIKICFLINKKTGPAGFFKPEEAENSITKLLEFGDGKMLEGLSVEYKYHEHYGFGSFHSKMILIDSHTALLFSGDPQKNSDYLVKNPFFLGQTEILSIVNGHEIAMEMRKNFFYSWNHSSNSKTQYLGLKLTAPETRIKAEDFKEEKYISNIPCLFIAKEAENWRKNYLSPFALALIMAINQAQRSADIMTPNLNSKSIIGAIAQAAARGVKVRIILGISHNDKAESMPGLGGTNRKNIELLMKKLVQLNNLAEENLQIYWAGNDKGLLVHHGDEQTMHGKYACIDSEYVLTGSSVCDMQSVHNSEEIDIILHSPEAAAIYDQKIFEPILKMGIRKETLQDYLIQILKKIAPLNSDEDRIIREILLNISEPQTSLGIIRLIKDYHDIEKSAKEFSLFKNSSPRISGILKHLLQTAEDYIRLKKISENIDIELTSFQNSR